MNCEFDCDPSGPNLDVHAPRCPIALEAKVAALEGKPKYHEGHECCKTCREEVAALSKDLARARGAYNPYKQALEGLFGSGHNCRSMSDPKNCEVCAIARNFASPSSPEAPSESAGKPCVCGDIMQPGIVHRFDGPCFALR